jgi:hypothetical protein
MHKFHGLDVYEVTGVLAGKTRVILGCPDYLDHLEIRSGQWMLEQLDKLRIPKNHHVIQIQCMDTMEDCAATLKLISYLRPTSENIFYENTHRRKKLIVDVDLRQFHRHYYEYSLKINKLRVSLRVPIVQKFVSKALLQLMRSIQHGFQWNITGSPHCELAGHYLPSWITTFLRLDKLRTSNFEPNHIETRWLSIADMEFLVEALYEIDVTAPQSVNHTKLQVYVGSDWDVVPQYVAILLASNQFIDFYDGGIYRKPVNTLAPQEQVLLLDDHHQAQFTAILAELAAAYDLPSHPPSGDADERRDWRFECLCLLETLPLLVQCIMGGNVDVFNLQSTFLAKRASRDSSPLVHLPADLWKHLVDTNRQQSDLRQRQLLLQVDSILYELVYRPLNYELRTVRTTAEEKMQYADLLRKLQRTVRSSLQDFGDRGVMDWLNDR